MGNLIEVWAWERSGGDYAYRLAYGGRNYITAIVTVYKLRRSGCGCIKFEWRGGGK